MQTDQAAIATAPEQFGLAFDIRDLLLAQAFAASCALRVAVETHHHTDCEELEEVIALYQEDGSACLCLIWRNAETVVVQPMPGRARRFACLSDALDWLSPEEPAAVSDLMLRGLSMHEAFGPWR